MTLAILGFLVALLGLPTLAVAIIALPVTGQNPYFLAFLALGLLFVGWESAKRLDSASQN